MISLRNHLMSRCGRGVGLQINRSFRCNLNCPYCTALNLGYDTRPCDPPNCPRPVADWQAWLERFVLPIKFFYISGGEPMLDMNTIYLTNWIVRRFRRPVVIYTNLTTDGLMRVDRSPLVSVVATYHHLCNKLLFLRNYNEAIKRHPRIAVDEIGRRVLTFSRLKQPIEADDDSTRAWRVLRAGPDLTLHLSCRDVSLHYATSTGE